MRGSESHDNPCCESLHMSGATISSRQTDESIINSSLDIEATLTSERARKRTSNLLMAVFDTKRYIIHNM